MFRRHLNAVSIRKFEFDEHDHYALNALGELVFRKWPRHHHPDSLVGLCGHPVCSLVTSPRKDARQPLLMKDVSCLRMPLQSDCKLLNALFAFPKLQSKRLKVAFSSRLAYDF